jgi:response regulator RpfG family c-di-GMP phosphodiesterase
MNHKVLVVDDEPANTRMLERLLKKHFDVLCAHSGSEGLEVLSIHDVSVIISDQRMPRMTGVEFLKCSAEMRPQCVRIILTGYTDASDLVEALNSNVVYKYITKPWVGPDLLQTVRRGLSHHETLKEQHRLGLENERLRDRLKLAEGCFLKICSELISLKNEMLKDRGSRIRDQAVMIGRLLRLDTETLDTLVVAASLIELADLYIPEDLSPSRNELTEDERILVEACRERGLALLEDVPGLGDVVSAIRYTPEHYDGSGFPSGLNGPRIPLVSRVLSVVKAFDIMVFPEKGIGAYSHEQAMAELQRGAGSDYDPNVVRAFCGLMAIEHVQGAGVANELSLVG